MASNISHVAFQQLEFYFWMCIAIEITAFLLNGFTIITFSSFRSLWTVHNFLLGSKCVNDFLKCLVKYPIYAASFGWGNDIFPASFCRYHAFVVFILSGIDCTIIETICINCYLRVIHCHWMGMRGILLLFLAGFIISIAVLLPIFTGTVVEFGWNELISACGIIKNKTNKRYLTFLLLLGQFPTIATFVSFGKILYHLKKKKQIMPMPENDAPGTSANPLPTIVIATQGVTNTPLQKHDKRFLIMSLSLFVVVLITTIPYLVVNIVDGKGNVPIAHGVSLLCVFSSAILNPLITFAFNKSLRRRFIKLVKILVNSIASQN